MAPKSHPSLQLMRSLAGLLNKLPARFGGAGGMEQEPWVLALSRMDAEKREGRWVAVESAVVNEARLKCCLASR